MVCWSSEDGHQHYLRLEDDAVPPNADGDQSSWTGFTRASFFEDEVDAIAQALLHGGRPVAVIVPLACTTVVLSA